MSPPGIRTSRLSLRRAASRALSLLAAAALVGGFTLEATGAEATNVHVVSRDYILGYATAVLERAALQHGFAIDFRDDALRVDFAAKPDVPFDTILRSLLTIEGVRGAEIFVAGQLAVRSGRSPASTASDSTAEPRSDTQTGGATERDADGTVVAAEPTEADEVYDIFSVSELFKPLIADPRWPRFSASHLWYLHDDELERVGSATFGESFSFVRSPREAWGQWEFGFQAGVFSVFDLEASSSDLVNSDFLVGLTFSHHFGDFTSILRLYHQSSHLGDEYLLRNRVDRINLSFEVLDLLVSYEPWQWLRLYAGGGLLVHREPALDRGIFQSGLELESPRAFAGGYLRPVAGLDLQLREESDWHADISALAGLQIEHPFLRRTRLRILGEFYSGRSPNGQFYDRRIETIGLGIHLGI